MYWLAFISFAAAVMATLMLVGGLAVLADPSMTNEQFNRAEEFFMAAGVIGVLAVAVAMWCLFVSVVRDVIKERRHV